uniref:Uncharacterized protein n=1 Tax=Candidatus Kentrum sp. LPFa TaxID=2126335 RepID=A0A450XP48_9GAMM|nr:MAG: hypothetical protein BECKLPF1236C_GA0070990_101281 [Candidatus Kentron sp. LPFa]
MYFPLSFTNGSSFNGSLLAQYYGPLVWGEASLDYSRNFVSIIVVIISAKPSGCYDVTMIESNPGKSVSRDLIFVLAQMVECSAG